MMIIAATGTTLAMSPVRPLAMVSETSPPGAAKITSATPWQAIIVPIVTASDWSPSPTTSQPLSSPTAAPISITATSEPNQPRTPTLVVATTTLAMAMTPMAERSSSPVSTTSVSPAAAIASTMVLSSRLVMAKTEVALGSLIA